MWTRERYTNFKEGVGVSNIPTPLLYSALEFVMAVRGRGASSRRNQGKGPLWNVRLSLLYDTAQYIFIM